MGKFLENGLVRDRVHHDLDVRVLGLEAVKKVAHDHVLIAVRVPRHAQFHGVAGRFFGGRRFFRRLFGRGFCGFCLCGFSSLFRGGLGRFRGRGARRAHGREQGADDQD